jgi:tetratricopeptide (TPR) repeat protein
MTNNKYDKAAEIAGETLDHIDELEGRDSQVGTINRLLDQAKAIVRKAYEYKARHEINSGTNLFKDGNFKSANKSLIEAEKFIKKAERIEPPEFNSSIDEIRTNEVEKYRALSKLGFADRRAKEAISDLSRIAETDPQFVAKNAIPLLNHLDDTDSKEEVLRTLRNVAEKKPSQSGKIVDDLVSNLENDDTRRSAIEALSEISDVAPKILEGHIQAICEATEHDDKFVYSESYKILNKIVVATPELAPDIADYLVTGLGDDAKREVSIRTIANIAEVSPETFENHIPAIGAAIGESDEEIQLIACQILKEIGTTESIERLRESRREVDDYDIRSEIETMIQEISKQSDQETMNIDSMNSSIPDPNKTAFDTIGDADSELPSNETIETIGSGGNANVKKVRLTDSDEIAALKIPRWQGTISTSVVEDFQSEAATWARIDDSAHIIDVLGSGAIPYPWILLEYMPDGSLRDRIEENRITLSTAQDILLDICRGVRHAHRHGIVHADLKPENVLFRDDTAKVGDWGLAKVLLEHSTSIEGMTPNYAAPEQLDPDQYGSVDDQTDVYQIGVMAYEMLTGTVPFEGSTPAGTITSILSDEPIPPSEHSSRLPTAVDDIILKAMAKEKKDRYESVLYLRDDVQELLTER